MGQVLMVVGSVLFVLLMAFVLAPLFAMLGWHLFMVPVFGMKGLTFFQALGLSILLGGMKSFSFGKKQ